MKPRPACCSRHPEMYRSSEVLRSPSTRAEVIGEITGDSQVVFEYEGRTIATIPNQPSPEVLEMLRR